MRIHFDAKGFFGGIEIFQPCSMLHDLINQPWKAWEGLGRSGVDSGPSNGKTLGQNSLG